MTETLTEIMAFVGIVLDAIGVMVVAIGILVAIGRALLRLNLPFEVRYPILRKELGRAILLGLELLIAGDIIRTVVLDPTLLNVAVLGLIVIIRTFLSMTLQLEIDGHLPWQPGKSAAAPPLH